MNTLDFQYTINILSQVSNIIISNSIIKMFKWKQNYSAESPETKIDNGHFAFFFFVPIHVVKKLKKSDQIIVKS